MKIVFDSHEQKRYFMQQMCPSEFSLDDNCIHPDCEKCWESAAEIDVEEDART